MSDLITLMSKSIKADDYVPRPRIVCADGESLSVQASEYSYCLPRETGAEQYTHVEVGFPSCVPNARMMEYCDDIDNPTDTIYAYVPVEVVLEFINEHGGFAK